MKIIDFETPTLNASGEVTAWTRYTAEQFTENLGKDVCLDLLIIPSGMYQMGSAHHHGNIEEEPQHLVTIKAFMMSKFLVTQGQWKAIMPKLPPCRFKGDDLPVERVSWEEAQNFCKRLSKKTRRYYQLPSETQWEYAC